MGTSDTGSSARHEDMRAMRQKSTREPGAGAQGTSRTQGRKSGLSPGCEKDRGRQPRRSLMIIPVTANADTPSPRARSLPDTQKKKPRDGGTHRKQKEVWPLFQGKKGKPLKDFQTTSGGNVREGQQQGRLCINRRGRNGRGAAAEAVPHAR